MENTENTSINTDFVYYSNKELREAVGILLSYIDSISSEGMHYRGMTPNWFVGAAMMALNIEPNKDSSISVMDCVRELKNEY